MTPPSVLGFLACWLDRSSMAFFARPPMASAPPKDSVAGVAGMTITSLTAWRDENDQT